jgi:sulfonate transport system ATP-binding protein
MTRMADNLASTTPAFTRSTSPSTEELTDEQAPSNRGTEIEFEGVAKEFGPAKVLVDVNLRVHGGEFVAFVGRSGSGKSTLLRIAAGLDSPTVGRVLVSSRPLTGINAHARMMFQDSRLLPWLRVGENVAVGQGGRMNDAVHLALQQVFLEGRIGDWPMVLSGGQRQRVALARALISKPSLLLLDEPLGSLDALTRIEMQMLIEALWERRKCSAVLVTHDIEEAVLLADRVLLLENGCIAAEFAVELPRPRNRTSSEFQAIVCRILSRVLQRDRFDGRMIAPMESS